MRCLNLDDATYKDLIEFKRENRIEALVAFLGYARFYEENRHNPDLIPCFDRIDKSIQEAIDVLADYKVGIVISGNVAGISKKAYEYAKGRMPIVSVLPCSFESKYIKDEVDLSLTVCKHPLATGEFFAVDTETLAVISDAALLLGGNAYSQLEFIRFLTLNASGLYKEFFPIRGTGDFADAVNNSHIFFGESEWFKPCFSGRIAAEKFVKNFFRADTPYLKNRPNIPADLE